MGDLKVLATAPSLTCATCVARPSAMDFSSVTAKLNHFVSAKTFPGAVYAVGDSSGLLHAEAVGHFTYDAGAPPMATSTLFDVASLTKVTATTTAAMLLYQWGELDLDTRLTNFYGDGFAATDPRKAAITVRNLLLHDAGWPPDPTPSYCTPSFACPETTSTPPTKRHTTFSCQHKIFASISTQKLARPPGAKYVYSDISMISLMFVVGKLARPHVKESELRPDCVAAMDNTSMLSATLAAPIDQCYFEAFVRLRVFSHLTTSSKDESFLGYLPPRHLWSQHIAPAWNDTTAGFPGECVKPYRERVLQGEVSDGNAFSSGGISGHAGVFASVTQLHSLIHQLLFATSSTTRLGVNGTTAKLFTTVANASFSSRALGWDTNMIGSYRGCGNFSEATFTHTGYTGTMLCADPLGARGGLTAVLFTNRVYPSAAAPSRILEARQAFSDAVMEVVRARAAVQK